MLDIVEICLAVFLTGFVVTYLLTPAARALAWKFGVVDKPDERRPHKRATARGGGIAVVIGVHAACLIALVFSWNHAVGEFSLDWWQHFALASLILLVVGVIDDVRGLSPMIKLAGQATAALIVSTSNVHFGALFGMELPSYLDRILVVIWLLAVINAFNLIDGLDGLASGLAITSGIGLCGIFVLHNQLGNALVMLGLIGACLAFLRYNFNPASIFLGDTGSMFIGFTLGFVSLQTFTKSSFIFSLTIPVLVIGVPIYDALLAIWRRSARMYLSKNQQVQGVRKRLGIMQPDVDHLHHRLVKAGISTRRVAILLCLGNLALVVFGLLMTCFRSHAAGLFLIVLLGGSYVVMRHLALIELRDTGNVLLGGLRRPSKSGLKSLAYPVWDMICLTGSVAISMALFEPPVPAFWHQWFLDLPVWVTPSFSLLAISLTYVTVWSKARMRDIAKLAFTLQLGLFISLGIALIIDPYSEIQKWFIRLLVVGAVSHPLMLGSRMMYRFIEELVNWSKAQSEINVGRTPIILYGAGGRCWLYLRERSFKNMGGSDGRRIVGIIDDDPSLNQQWIYGFQILGGSKSLSKIVKTHRIQGIVITAILTKESHAAIEEFAAEHQLQLSEWRCSEEQIALEAPLVSPTDEAKV